MEDINIDGKKLCSHKHRNRKEMMRCHAKARRKLMRLRQNTS